VHIRFHKLSNDVDVLKASWSGRLGYIKNLNNVLVVKEFEQPNLSDNALCINQILKCLWNFLNCDFDAGNMVVSGTNYSVSTMSNLFNVLKLFINAESSA